MLALPHRCPCCGTHLALVETATWHDKLNLIETPYGSRIMTNTKARIFDLIWRAKPSGVPMDRLVEAVWPGIDGPPEHSDCNIRVHCAKLRKMLQPLGIVLVHGEKGGQGYHVVITTPEDAAVAIKKIRERSGWSGWSK